MSPISAIPEWVKDYDAACQEAYQHGRTQQRLRTARYALQRIASGKLTSADACRSVAKLALDLIETGESV